MALFTRLNEPTRSAPVPGTFAPPPTPTLPPKLTAKRRSAPQRNYRRITIHRPSDIAADLGESIATAWNRGHGGPHIEIPLSATAALALLPFKTTDQDPTPIGDWLLTLDGHQLMHTISEVWTYWWLRRPDLIDVCRPLVEAIETEQHNANTQRAVSGVVEAALAHGLLELTGHNDPAANSDADILGPALTMLRSPGAIKGTAEYHTPHDLSDVIARVTIGVDTESVDPGASFLDPAAGTGNLIRSAAQYLRDLGKDPAGMAWTMVDVDPLAAACCAANAALWGLGNDTTVVCGDSLADPEAVTRARQRRTALYGHRDRVVGAAHLTAAVATAEGLVQQLTAPDAS